MANGSCFLWQLSGILEGGNTPALHRRNHKRCDMISRNAASRHANFTKFCQIVNIDVKNQPWKFQIYVSKIGYFAEQFVEYWKKLVCKIQNGLWNAVRVKWRHQLYWVMSYHQYLYTDQFSSVSDEYNRKRRFIRARLDPVGTQPWENVAKTLKCCCNVDNQISTCASTLGV